MSERLFWSILLSLTVASGVHADHNKQLQREFRRGMSRHLAYDSQGYGYLLVPSVQPQNRRRITLRVSSAPHPQSISDFSLIAKLPELPKTKGSSWFSAGLVVDPHDRLHVAWTTEAGFTAYSVVETKQLRDNHDRPQWLDPATGSGGALVVAAKRSWVGDLCLAPDGSVWLTWIAKSLDDAKVNVHLATLRNGTWRSFRLGQGKKFYPPVLLFSQDGKFIHLACGDTIGGTHLAKIPVAGLQSGKEWGFERTHSGNRPALAETRDGILAVHESGDSLKYTFLDADRRSHPLTDLDQRLKWDTVHSPRQVVDQHGIPWLFFIDSTRQHVFYARWLGTRWSPILNGFWLTRNTPRFEDNHLSIDWLSAEYGLGKNKSSIGLVIGHRSQYPTAKYHVLPVPSLRAESGKKVLFLDLMEVQRISGVEQRVNTARKFSGNPILSAGKDQAFDSQGAANIAVVKQANVYRAWYSGLHREPGSQWPTSGSIPRVRIGYAESSNGRDFKKKVLGLASFGTTEDTNLVAGLPATPIFRPIVPTGMHIDTADPDPARRFKFLTWTGGRPLRKPLPDPEDDEQTWTLWTSRDGLSWKEASRGGIRYPAGMPSSFSPQSMFHDPDEPDPAKRYKAYGFIGLNNDRRGAGYGFSADAVEWTAAPRNPVFDPWARAVPVVRSGKVEQIHDVVVWKYHQYYLALYQYQRSGDAMTIELAVSRDGENFTYVQPGSEVVKRGAAGAWDADSIAPSVPLVDDNEIKVYYSGYRFSKTKRIEGERSCGLATLRQDGFAHMMLSDDRKEGSLTTIPIKPGSATELYVNAACRDGSRLEAELIDPKTQQPLVGFSRRQCTPIKSDSLAHRITWNNRSLRDLKAPFQIRFHFSRGRVSPELFSLKFR